MQIHKIANTLILPLFLGVPVSCFQQGLDLTTTRHTFQVQTSQPVGSDHGACDQGSGRMLLELSGAQMECTVSGTGTAGRTGSQAEQGTSRSCLQSPRPTGTTVVITQNDTRSTKLKGLIYFILSWLKCNFLISSHDVVDLEISSS